VPYDPDGPPGQTGTENLACLCRLHHRMKTHADWTYYVLTPGVFGWHSPHGHLAARRGRHHRPADTVEPPDV
jgi:hypothetical protein